MSCIAVFSQKGFLEMPFKHIISYLNFLVKDKPFSRTYFMINGIDYNILVVHIFYKKSAFKVRSESVLFLHIF